MATDKALAPNIDNSDLTNYPNARIKDNTGSGDGTPVNRLVYGDIHEFFAKLMRLSKTPYNGLPDNETNGYQLVDALLSLANKNNKLATLASVAGVLQITTVKLSTMVLNELLICKASADYGTETEITDSEAGVSYTITIADADKYKANDYVLLLKNDTGITVIRLVAAGSLDAMVSALNYLKAATNAQTQAGSIDTAAVTPASLKDAFTQWVTDVTASAPYLATDTTPGLMSKDDKTLLDSLNNPVKNVGWFSGVDPGGATVGTLAPKSGDIVSAQVTAKTDNSNTYLITLANAMADTNYFVRSSIQSESNVDYDKNILCPVFRPVSPTTFSWTLKEYSAYTQSLKIHIEVVQL